MTDMMNQHQHNSDSRHKQLHDYMRAILNVPYLKGTLQEYRKKREDLGLPY